jgi:hypothetical protein
MAVGVLEQVVAAPLQNKKEDQGLGYVSINRPPLTGFVTTALWLPNAQQARLWTTTRAEAARLPSDHRNAVSQNVQTPEHAVSLR